jgi:hypothetical protein
VHPARPAAPKAATVHHTPSAHHHAGRDRHRDDHDGRDPRGDDDRPGPGEQQLRKQVADSFCDRYHLPRATCEQAAAGH